MLEDATVTLSYKEFQDLKEKADESENLNEKIFRLEEMLENEVERKALDKICNILVDATHLANTSKKKQECIADCIEIYCNTFDIPIPEIME